MSYLYGSRARPLEWIWARGYIKSISIEKIKRLSQGIDYPYEKLPYFNIIILPQPLTKDEVKGLELNELTPNEIALLKIEEV